MNALKLKLTLPIAAILATVASCSPKVAEIIALQKTEVDIDGQANEYGEFRYYNSEAKMFYALSNDSSNLYLCLKVNDETMQQQIIMAGMDVWLDTLSKSKERIGIRYPLGGIRPTAPSFREAGEPKGKPDMMTQMKKELLLSQKTMDLRGFKNVANGSNLMQTPEGIKLQVDWDNSNSMIYELVIPLKNWYKANLTKSDTTKIFTLTININALEMPSGPPGGFSGPPPGGNTPSGGGMGGPPSGMRPPMDGLSEKKTVKANFKLHINVP
ncbi:MAG: hypothetical protein Q8M29_00810 [Bacteroidota bacterium]|nr:hypothetical protein [Bacteroidota bacterium]